MTPTAVLLDLDGVVWLSRVPIPGSVAAVARLRSTGRRVVFVTNNSGAPLAEQEAALAAIGIPAKGDVITSAIAAAALITAGQRVLVCGGPGVAEAIRSIGATAIAGDDPGGVHVDAVMVGFHPQFDYERMRIASTAARNGARLIATNDDATYPTPDGPIPGGGAILAGVRTASGVDATVAGKPYRPMAAAIESMLGGTAPGQLLMVGDRQETDGEFAVALGCPFALVRSGVTLPGQPVTVPVSIDAPDLAAVVDAIEATDGHR
ncbi:MAG: HAD-IIA family hydrolase [Ilumatobacteraceae bacterium]